MALSQKLIEDPATLRALVHPLRMKLLGALRVDGPATASALGRRFGESSGSTSYHLRQLARYGFVVEDDDQPSKRERRWRAVHDVTSWRTSDFAGDEEGRAAVRELERHQLRALVERVQRWQEEPGGWPAAWVDAASISDLQLRLRPDDVTALNAELYAILQRYAADQRPGDDPEAAPVSFYLLAIPARDERP